MAPKFGGAIVRDSSLNACRRNNKMEKRRRNRDYARKFQGVRLYSSEDMSEAKQIHDCDCTLFI